MISYDQLAQELAGIEAAAADGVISQAEAADIRDSLVSSWQCSRDARAVTVPRAGAQKPLVNERRLCRFTESVGYTLLAARVGMIDDQTAVDLLALFLDAEACHNAALDLRRVRTSFDARQRLKPVNA